MRKIRNILVGAALAGSLAGGLALAPAAQASTAGTDSAATQAQSPRKHFFGPIYSDYGRGENRGDRSYFKGYWYERGGRYYFVGDLFDGDHDRQYSYVWFRWHDDNGSHQKFFKTYGRYHYERNFSRSSGFDDFDISVGEGSNNHDDQSGWDDSF